MSERQEAGKRILSNINDAIDNELLEDIFPALCWILGALGTETSIDKESFMSLMLKGVSSAYDVHMTESEDATTH